MSRPNIRTLISALFLLTLGLLGSAGSIAAQSNTNRAGLVIQFPGGDTRTYCLEFEGEGITGLDLLLKTGLDVKVEVQGLGALICSIGATGCDYPAQTCVCQSYGPNGVYWAYHHLQDGKWRTSITGASTYQVKPNSVEGWAWGEGGPPTLYTFDQICQVATPPTNTPQPPPTNSPEPTDTSIPQPTSTPIPPPTNTIGSPPRPTNTRIVDLSPTSTRPPQPTNTSQPQPPTQEPQSTPTEIPAVDTPTPTATETATEIPTSTLSPTSTSLPTNTTAATQTTTPTATTTSTPISTPTLQPTPGPTIQIDSAEDRARSIGLQIAGVVVVALVVLFALAQIRPRKSPPTNGDPL